MSKGKNPPAKPSRPPALVLPTPVMAADPCADLFIVAVASAITPAPADGSLVALVRNGRIYVALSDLGQIGVVGGPDAVRMSKCEQNGWTFGGEVISSDGITVVLRIWGVQSIK